MTPTIHGTTYLTVQLLNLINHKRFLLNRGYIALVHLGGCEQKRGWPYIFSMPQHCFVAKQSNAYLFCRKTLNYSTFCRETLRYGTLCLKTLKYAP